MRIRKTFRDAISLPEAIIRRVPDVTGCEAREEAGRTLRVPLRESRAEEVRARLQALGITERDLAEAVRWGRG